MLEKLTTRLENLRKQKSDLNARMDREWMPHSNDVHTSTTLSAQIELLEELIREIKN